MIMRMTPAIRFCTKLGIWAPPKCFASAPIPMVATLGSTMNSATLRITPSTIPTVMTAFISLSPKRRTSHFSKRVSGSSVSIPFMAALSSRLAKESFIISTIFTHPRIMGKFQNLFFFLMDVNFEFLTSILPSGRRTARDTSSPLFIITPSSTACPPTFPRRSFFSFFIVLYYPFGCSQCCYCGRICRSRDILYTSELLQSRCLCRI